MKFLRKPLALLSCALLVVGVVLAVIIALVPHGTTYKATYTVGNVTTEYELTFKDNKLYTAAIVNGKDTVPEKAKKGIDVTIKNGKVFMMTEEAYNAQLDAANKLTGDAKDAALKALNAEAAYKISSTKLSPIKPEDQSLLTQVVEGMKAQYGVEDPVFVCGTNTALLYVGVAVAAVGLVGLLVSCVFITLDKKGTKKTAEAK